MGENEYAFLCSVTAFWLSKSLKFHFFTFKWYLRNPAIKKLRNTMMWCMTYKLRHVVCRWRRQILRKKILHAFAMGENEYALLCSVTAFWLSKSLKFHFFHFLMVFTKPCL